MPSRWEVDFLGPAEPAVPLTAPLAVVSGWLDDPRPGRDASPASAAVRSSHNDRSRKWACGPLRTAAPAFGQAGAITTLGVRLLDDSLSARLQKATSAGQAVRLGEDQYRVIGGARQVGYARWPDLRLWPGTRAWQMRFITPTCLRRHNRTSPWLAPESLARSLAERWHRLDPDTAPPPPGPGPGPVWISDLDGRSEVQGLTRRVNRGGRWQLEEEVISGFVGRIRFVCDTGTDDQAATFHAFMAFAAFAGIGAHTTHGFGVTLPEPTWQPPTQTGQPRTTA